ncbi:hypothetical protein J6590_055505 [Homalodisca vitripennis]|nr:hypothetical protein J6590_055505 [Homalodisca vitripennis]
MAKKRPSSCTHSPLAEEKMKPDTIDKVICAEIHDPELDPAIHEIFKSRFMWCSPCMINGFYSKKLRETQLGMTSRSGVRVGSLFTYVIELQLGGAEEISPRALVVLKPALMRGNALSKEEY